MKLYKPKFWKKRNILSVSLIPLSLILYLCILLKKKFTKIVSYKIPVICIGNIYIGGTGKTPLSLYVANELKKRGKNPVIVRKYYKNHKDEHDLIKKNFKSFILNKSRDKAIREAEKRGFDSVILDDGFQDYKIKKDLNIICFNSNQLDGNGLIIPAGPLRENFSSLKDAEIVIINGKKTASFEKKIFKINNDIQTFYSEYKPIDIQRLKDKKFIAVVGIGNPENFLSLLKENGINVLKNYILPDHYQFSKKETDIFIKDAENNDCEVILTEKDYYKVKNHNLNRMECLKVLLNIEEKEKFFNTILKIYD